MLRCFCVMSDAGSVHFRKQGPVHRAQTCDAGRAGVRPYRRLGGSRASACRKRKVGEASPLCTRHHGRAGAHPYRLT
jgi:hypothetical protein